MSFRSRSLSVLVLSLGIAGATYAQDSKTTTPDSTDKAAHSREHGRADGFRGGRWGRAGDFGDRKFGRRGFGGDMGRLGGVTLTDAQKAQIKQIREANKPDPTTFQELRTIMEARRSGALTDAQKARAKEIREQQSAKAESVRSQIENVLTADQKAQIKQNLEQRKEHRQEMREQFRKNHTKRPDVTKTTPTTKIS